MVWKHLQSRDKFGAYFYMVWLIIHYHGFLYIYLKRKKKLKK